MKAHRALFIPLIALALALSCSASGAREGAAPGGDAAKAAPAALHYREGITAVDFTGMDEATKERVLKILNQERCDCGCKFESIAECRVKDQGCSRSPALAKIITDAIRAGKSDDEAVAALKAAQKPAATAATAPPAPAPVGPVQISMEGAPVKGSPSARVTLVEYADFQCPYCVRAQPVVEQLLAKYGGDLKYAFKQLPLTSIHPFAEPAARASLAAGKQGKFWEMHDALFRNSRALDEASLRKYAEGLGLDLARFDKDRNDPVVSEQINKDVAESQRIGVTGTPSFFINGVKVPSWDVDTMSKMIDAAKSGGDVAAVANEILQRFQEQARQQAAQRAAQAQAEASRVVDIDIAGSPIKGSPGAPVTIVEFGDFQCPYCANSQPLLKQVLEAYPGKVKLVFKHLPLNIHANARPAAIASLEALEQGKFWEMHDLLFQNYAQLTRDNLTSIAKQVGLDMAQFEKALQTDEHKQIIDKDIADSEKAGVGFRTPSFYVNGKRVMQRDFDTFKKMIDEVLSAANQRAAS